MKKYAITLFASALLLTWTHAASAQTTCEDALRDAQKSYEIGLFEDVPTKLSPCLGTPISRALAVQVHSLLARAYLNNDEPEKARKEISTLLRLQSNYEAEAGSSGRFLALVAEVRRAEQTTQVVSVSKTSESLREAPATVIIITAADIQRRGYIDLEQLLHDLPGFDVSLLNGENYSIANQRGFNSPENDRLLFLVDGVEQNDLSFGTPYLSRQYPLSNIDRVEVVYGPATTMYGANAHTGLISVITREPESIVGQNKEFGIVGEVTAGGYGTRSVDVTAAGTGSNGVLAWSITTNLQQSRARDLSNLDDWNYTYRNFDYKSFMRLSGTPQQRQALCAVPSPYIQCSELGIGLTDTGAELVRNLDRNLIRDSGTGFDDRAKNWSVSGKLRISNLTIGLQSWRSQEGIASGVGSFVAGNTSWTPRVTALFLKYSIPLESLKLNVFVRYVQTSLDRAATRYDYLHNYANGWLSLSSLVPPCKSLYDPQPVSCAPASPWVEKTSFGALSSQMRSEVNLVYEPSRNLNVVTGVEFAKSTIQSQLDEATSAPVFSSGTAPEWNGHSDGALYAQGSYRTGHSLRFVAAGRLSYDQIGNNAPISGYGSLFTPRMGVIYSPFAGRVVVKAIYAQAFKTPTDQERYGKFGPIGFSNKKLKPDWVRNTELSASWARDNNLDIDAAVYRAHYTGVVNLGYPRADDGTLVSDCSSTLYSCNQLQNRDDFLVRGLQATSRYRISRTEIWANVTHTISRQMNPLDYFGSPVADDQGNRVREIRVADIASNQFNVGVDCNWNARFRTGLRVHYVGARRTGAGTTYPDSPFTQMDARSTADVTFSYRTILPNITLQLVADNVLNKNYYDGGSIYTTPRVLQSGRTVYLRLLYRYQNI